MKTIEISTASRTLAEYARSLNGGVTLLTDRHKPVAAIVSLKGVDAESLALSSHPEFLELIDRSRAELDAGKGLSLAEMKRLVLPKRKVRRTLRRP